MLTDVQLLPLDDRLRKWNREVFLPLANRVRRVGRIGRCLVCVGRADRRTQRTRSSTVHDDEEQDDDDGERDGVDVAHLATSPGLAGWPPGGFSRFCSWMTIHSTMATTGM